LPTRFVACVIIGIAVGVAAAGAAEPNKAAVIEQKMAPLPEATAIDGPLPRPLLMVKLDERGEFVDDRTDSSYWVFDPAAPEKGLYKIFSGPGQSQYLRFMTPLFGGWGVASGRLDPEKEPEEEGPWFWFNLLNGKSGPTIDADMSWRWMDKGWLVGERTVGKQRGRSINRIARYHPLQAVVKTTEMDFSYINWLGRSEVIGVAKLDDGERVVRLNAETSHYEIIAEPPPGFHENAGRWGGYSISPARKDGRDGVYAIDGFSLWFRPMGGDWNPVIRDVHIVKTFGGAPPWLPVRYVGDGKFAVAKTVKDEVEVPESTPRDEAGFGAAEAVTMLIDGITGEVLKKSAPHVYNHNPSPLIPDDWWAAGLKPEPPGPEAKRKSLFLWNEDQRELRFTGGGLLQLVEDDERLESDDGRYLLIYQKCPRGGGKQQTKVPFRIIDGKTGEMHSAEVKSDFYEVWVDVSWRLLCSESPDPQTLQEFQDGGPGP
jgi:hypothetical protein